MSHLSIRRSCLILLSSLLLPAALSLSSCHVTPFQRTLPDWVQRVNLTMAVNKSYEPGLEELVTKSFQEEIVADGRLELVSKTKADVVIKLTILKYAESSAGFSHDRIEDSRERLLTVGMELF